jgi:hypothetical protein
VNTLESLAYISTATATRISALTDVAPFRDTLFGYGGRSCPNGRISGQKPGPFGRVARSLNE